MYERMMEIMKGVGTPKVLVVGDFMLDHYLFGNIDRISPEAPVVVMNVTERQEQPGGAGSVVADLAALEVAVACMGVVGDDANGRKLCDMLAEMAGVNIDGLVSDSARPTTSKQRIVGLAQHRHRQQLMRIDEEDTGDISEATQEELRKRLDKLVAWCDVVCLEDYDKGVLCHSFAQQVIAAAGAAGKKVIVDPARLSDYSRYAGAWLVKPNRREVGIATGIEINGNENWHEAVGQLARDYDIANLVVTLDKSGAYLYQRDSDKGELIPTRPRSVYDVTGAGDMVLAALGTLIGAHYDNIEKPTLEEVVRLANVAGGLEVEKFGCVGITRGEIIAELSRERRDQRGKIYTLALLLQELEWQRDKTIVFTNGCYDLLHPGHIELLNFAKKQGDILIVAINSDRSVRELKGESRPILKEQDRMALVSALEMVDYVVLFDEETPKAIIEQVSPNVLIKGSDWTGAVVGQGWVESHGGKVVLMPLVAGRSTTGIIDKVLASYGEK
ncbi:MAG: bifunctional heptose 7-phosphate kinase/heptose 1-phosphate adenyltransferase [Phycisphaerae bacterium]|nr:bifunctional heptose 7-phosphate kinase/heptose 1-phosphate adenyltransferase [Phycisphaerae bacterium]